MANILTTLSYLNELRSKKDWCIKTLKALQAEREAEHHVGEVNTPPIPRIVGDILSIIPHIDHQLIKHVEALTEAIRKEYLS